MSLFTWNDTFSVNVVEIDRQHQKLVEMLNELADAMKLGKGHDVLGSILNGLINYAATHFRTEEKYFDQFSYPEKNTHVQEHLVFVEKISDFQAKFEKKEISLTIDVLNFLCEWLKNHIKGEDKKYSRFFNQNGLS